MDITVDQESKPGGWQFDVTVKDEQGSTEHTVKLSENYYQQLTNGAMQPEALIRETFQFLLDKEPKEQILSSFNLRQVQRYYSDYENSFRRR